MKTDVEKNVKKEKLKKLTAKALMTFYRKQTILSIRVRGSIIYVRTSIEDEKGKKTMRTVILLYDECCDKRYNSFWHTLTADYIDTANVVKAHFILLVNKSITDANCSNCLTKNIRTNSTSGDFRCSTSPDISKVMMSWAKNIEPTRCIKKMKCGCKQQQNEAM